MRTLPELILDNLHRGCGQFTIETTDLCQRDCHGAIMDTKIGANRVVITMRFSSGNFPAHRTITQEKPYGVMVSHVIGAIAKFRQEVEKEGWNSGWYEVLVSVSSNTFGKTNAKLANLGVDVGARPQGRLGGLVGRVWAVPRSWQLERVLQEPVRKNKVFASSMDRQKAAFEIPQQRRLAFPASPVDSHVQFAPFHRYYLGCGLAEGLSKSTTP